MQFDVFFNGGRLKRNQLREGIQFPFVKVKGGSLLDVPRAQMKWVRCWFGLMGFKSFVDPRTKQLFVPSDADFITKVINRSIELAYAMIPIANVYAKVSNSSHAYEISKEIRLL